MPIAGTVVPLNTADGEDKVTITEKVTTPYHSAGATEIVGTNLQSASVTDTNEKYYFGIAHTSTPTTAEWNVAFGSTNGYGADTNGGDLKSKTEAIYKQYASMLLPANEVTGGFFISRNNSLASVPAGAKVSSGKDQEIFVLASRRTNQKDRINKKNWTVHLSGSLTAASKTPAPILHLTDDSVNDTPVASPFGDRYNIVSGTLGTVKEEATTGTYGFFYPDPGIMVFSGAELSASIPGKGGGENADTVIYKDITHKGLCFPTTANDTANRQTALRFINCLAGMGATKLSFRDEEDQVSVQYFCRIKSGQMNFSNNPTFISGSLNELRQSTMKGNPTTFVNQVQLYNSTGDVVAVAHLSTPLKKNFSSEATIKVKLTY